MVLCIRPFWIQMFCTDGLMMMLMLNSMSFLELLIHGEKSLKMFSPIIKNVAEL